MINFNYGPLSFPNHIACLPATFKVLTFLLCLHFFPLHSCAEIKENTPQIQIKAISAHSWSITVHLDRSVDPESVLFLSQIVGQSGFEGFIDASEVDPDRLSITYFLTGPSNVLPSSAEVAVIYATDDAGGRSRAYQVRTDGAGTMLLMDEF